MIARSAAVEQLPPEQQAELAKVWQMRADSERSVGSVFTQLVSSLSATGAHDEVIALARRAMDDETRHARVCAELAAAYRGDDVREAPPLSVRLPDYGEPPRMRAALHAVNLCCIGETIATAFVEACHAACDAWPELRELHGRHLADEIHHARVGWAHLASLSLDERRHIATHLPQLLRAQVRTWEERIALLPEHGIHGHGYPPRAALIAIVYGAIRDVVLPGFDYVEVDTRESRAWFEDHTSRT
ncbi:MAG: hypothetical protein AB7T06_17325 [Kofleriaceae bacterium]